MRAAAALDASIARSGGCRRSAGYCRRGSVAFAVVIVCQMVFVRYVLNQNTIWQTDFVTYCMAAATFIGSPYVLLTRGHVNVDVLPLYLGRARASRWRCSRSCVARFLRRDDGADVPFWKEAWDNRWVSDTMWRARLWIPYARCRSGSAS